MTRPTIQETYWVLRAQCGDREALEALLLGVMPVLTRYVARLGVTDGGDDVVQEVLIAVARKVRWLKSAELFRPWMFRIATRAAIKHSTREKRWSRLVRDEETLSNAATIETSPSDGRLLALLQNGQLSPASRAVLLLHFEEEMTLPEVAATLQIPLGTVKSRLGYGLAALRTLLREQTGDHDE